MEPHRRRPLNSEISNEQRLEFPKAFHKHFFSLLLWLIALFGSPCSVKVEERMLLAIGELSILYFGAHLWIIQRTIDRSSLHLQPNWTVVLLASIIFGVLIYSNLQSQIKWLVIWTFPWVVPATNPYLLQLVLDRTSKTWKHLVEASRRAFEQLHGKFSRSWIARRTMLSSEREVPVNQEASHAECNFGDELV